MKQSDNRPAVPRPRKGLLHIADAARYSFAGLQRLFKETAARLELAGAILGTLLLAGVGAGFGQILTFLGLCAGVLIVETLNTALEVLTDHVSPDWSEAARDAKDLGSLAVALSLICAGSWLVFVLFFAQS